MKSIYVLREKIFTIPFLGKVGFAALIVFIYLSNTFHESYPDEFDNILGGWYILHGRLIYTGFFTHHGPVAYYLAVLVELFSGQSFVWFRFFYAFFLLGITFGTYWYLLRRFGKRISGYYPFFIIVLGISSTYIWGHMLLADSISSLFLLPVFIILLYTSLYNEKLTLSDFIVISLGCFLAQFSSLTYTYLVGIIYIYTFYLWVLHKDRRVFTRENGKIISVVLLPFLLFAFYLVITGSIGEYIYQNFVFNEKFYIYNYPRVEGARINPIRFAIVIAYEFLNNFSTLILFVKDMNFAFPFTVTLAIANVGMFVYFLSKRKFALAIFLVLWLIYANARSNPVTSRETDYQAAVYIVTSLFIVVFLLYTLYQELLKDVVFPKKLLYSFFFILLGVYTVYTGGLLLRKYTDKVYQKYMGNAPLIYDRPDVAPIINAITTKDDYAWIGPFAFEELFYLKAKIPSKYHILIGGIGKSEKTQKEMLADFTANKPKVMYFDKKFYILISNPEMHAPWFIEFTKQNYITLYDYREGKIRYRSVVPISQKVDLETKLYINKEKKDEVIHDLLLHNYIRQEQQ